VQGPLQVAEDFALGCFEWAEQLLKNSECCSVSKGHELTRAGNINKLSIRFSNVHELTRAGNVNKLSIRF
jgi:hypothetical protein